MAQLIALPLFLLIVWRLLAPGAPPAARWALAAAAFAIAVLLLQIVPFPRALMALLANPLPRQAALEALAGLSDHSWAQTVVSLSPGATVLALLAGLPALTIFLGVALLERGERRALSLVLLAFVGFAVFLGLAQLAQGPGSPLRFFSATNPNDAVAFFANRNHFAALLYTAVLYAGAWAAQNFTGFDAANGRTATTTWIMAALATVTLLVLLLGAQAMTRSRTGLALTIGGLLGAALLMASVRPRGTGTGGMRLLAATIAIAVLLSAQFAVYGIMERFGYDTLADTRGIFARNTAALATAFMPAGAGLGTFVPVYASVETTSDVVLNAFANRAHNDFLEFWLETGLAGLLIMGAFLLWLAARGIAVWRRPIEPGTLLLDVALPRSATLAIGLLLVHSLVDYPLRTNAMLTVFAVSCAFLIPPPGLLVELEQRSGTVRQGRRKPTLRRGAPAPEHGANALGLAPEHQARALGLAPEHQARALGLAPEHQANALGLAPEHGASLGGTTSAPGGRWGVDIEWPEAWRKPPGKADNR